MSIPHFNATHGESRTRLYRAWINMRNRCRYASADRNGDYLARGIQVCSEWDESYEAFRVWALDHGYEASLTIDRVDNNAGYSPENCRWVDRETQANNKRNNRWVEAWGETKTVSQWGRDPRATVKMATIWIRLQKGLTPEEAISLPPAVNQHR